MNESEIKKWVNSAEYVGDGWCEYDDFGMFYEDRYFHKDGKYFLVHFTNGSPHKNVNGEYTLIPVERREKIVKEVYYEII